jgi:hypothetical protein
VSPHGGCDFTEETEPTGPSQIYHTVAPTPILRLPEPDATIGASESIRSDTMRQVAIQI